LLAHYFSETDSPLISKREDFENLSVAPSLAIGAATMCHILCKALRVFHLRQGSSLPPMDVSIIRKKFDALDASAKNRVMRLFALAGFPTIRHQFVFASTPLVTFLVDKVICHILRLSVSPHAHFYPDCCSQLHRQQEARRVSGRALFEQHTAWCCEGWQFGLDCCARGLRS
jgi:hypothetical protein